MGNLPPTPIPPPVPNPTPFPTPYPTPLPTPYPTPLPTGMPTGLPTGLPTTSPTAAPTGLPTGDPTAAPTCIMELFPDADACSVSSQWDGAHCGRTLDGQHDTGWHSEEEYATNQWIAYDLKATHTVTGVCLVWDWYAGDMYGATSVRVDTSDDGSSWTEGATYDENDGMLAGDGDPSSLPDVMDACFAISPVETQHIRLFLEQAVDVYLGIAEVRFVELRAITLEEADNCLSLGSYSYSYSYSYALSTSTDQCFLNGGGCTSCCPQCEDLIALESGKDDEVDAREATRCVCFSGEASSVSGIYLSKYDDCLHITGTDNWLINGYHGDDVIVLTGDQNGLIYGGSGDDVITLTGHDNEVIDGGYGDDAITLTGHDNVEIDGGDGDDTIIIYGDDNDEIYGGDGRDSCSIVSSDGGVTPVDDCETAAPPAPTAVPTAQATP